MESTILIGEGGRLTLINAVLDALPTYMLTLFPIPAGVVMRLDKLRRNFFCKEKRKVRIPSSKMESSNHRKKKQGGLGIRNLKNHRKALKLK